MAHKTVAQALHGIILLQETKFTVCDDERKRLQEENEQLRQELHHMRLVQHYALLVFDGDDPGEIALRACQEFIEWFSRGAPMVEGWYYRQPDTTAVKTAVRALKKAGYYDGSG